MVLFNDFCRVLLVFVVFLVSVCVYGQDDDGVVLFDDKVKVGGYGAERYTFGFKGGDRMVYSFIGVSHRAFKAVVIREENGRSVVARYRKPENIVNMELEVPEDGVYSFHFKNKGLFGRKVAFTLKRVPKVVPPPDTLREVVYRDTIVVDTVRSVEALTKTVFDTVPEQLLDMRLSLSAARNLYGDNRVCEKLPIPLNVGNYYWSYWVGFGDDALDMYEALSSSPPKSWGGHDALTAYGLGLTDYLPGAGVEEDFDFFVLGGDDFRQDFERGRSADRSGVLLQGYPSLYRRVVDMGDVGVYPFYFCFDNRQSISPVTLYLKVVGFRIEERVEEIELERLVVTERVEKVRVGERVVLVPRE